VKESVKL